MALLGFPELHETASSDDGLQDYRGRLTQKRKINLWAFLTGTFGAPRLGKLWLESASNMWLKYHLKRRRKLMKKRVLSDSSLSLIQKSHVSETRSLEPNGGDLELCCWGIKRRRNQKESAAAMAASWRRKSQCRVAVCLGYIKQGLVRN